RASASVFAKVPAARCCGRGSCNIGVRVPRAGCCWARPRWSAPRRRDRRQGRRWARSPMGKAPQGERAERRDADRLTLRKAVDEYLAVRKRELRTRSFFETARYLSGNYFRPLHGMPLDTIERRDVATCIVRIARESGNPTASQARSKLSA